MVRGREVRLVHLVEGPYLLKKAAESPLFLLVVKGVDKTLQEAAERAGLLFG
jgi:hypothetical protein